MLANCSAAEKFARTDKTQRIAEDAEIAKGGGHYKLGKPYSVNGQTYTPTEEPNYRAEGIASWYGPDFHGRLTANGELYNMHGYSAAHPTLPIPSYARVTNLKNGKSIIVRVNNRGPFVHNRLVDLSVGTAKALEFYGRGITRVRLEYVGRAPIEGSDDRMLLATLREGTPAPAPSQVMVASAKPFLPARESKTPLPAERPFALGSTVPRAAPQLASAEFETRRPNGVEAQTRRGSAEDRGRRPDRPDYRAGSSRQLCAGGRRRDERPRSLLTGRKIDARRALIPASDAC